MSDIIQAINVDDLTNTSVTQEYPLGSRYVDQSSTGPIKNEYIYLRAHSGLSVQQPFQLSLSNVTASAVTSKAPVTTASGATVFISPGASENDYFWGQVKGTAIVRCSGFAAGDYGEVLNAGTTLVLDGGVSGSTVESDKSVGIATTSESGGLATFLLSGNKVQIAAA